MRASTTIATFTLWLLGACDAAPATPDAAPTPDAGRDAGMPDAYEPPLEPDLVCPGMPGCEEGGDPQIHAGFGVADVTPAVVETFTDLNGDATWQPEEEPFDDVDGDGVFDGQWIAGFGHARAAQGVMNPLWARAVVLRVGNTTLAMVAIDCVGWMIDEIDMTRERLAEAGLDVDYLVVGATHDHQGRDTIGIWGPSISDTGLDPEYQALVQRQSVEAVRQALADMRPANVQYASVLLRDVDSPSDVNRYVGDNRHPNILDDEIRILRFVEAGSATAGEPGSGTTIGTIVNFASHPEYQGSRNPMISSDWPHWMREAVERGIERGPDGAPVPGIGGHVVFFNGALGVQIGPNRLHVRDWEGNAWPEDSDASARTVGTQIGYFVLAALRGTMGTTSIEDTAGIAFRRARFFVTIQNRAYHIAGQQMLFRRMLYNYDETRPIDERRGNLPDVLTEIAMIDVGEATMLTVPGELDPAEWLGGYEPPCPYTPGGCENLLFGGENPPDLSRAPEGPFLRDVLREVRPEARQFWCLGLTNDMLGYFIPDFDYELAPTLPYLAEAPGQHYEETNSIGPLGWPRIRSKIHELVRWRP